jgi:hypothetical protein
VTTDDPSSESSGSRFFAGKLPDTSLLVLLITAVLYILGFLTVAAYLFRFGFADFDILNARYLIGGVLPLIGIFMSFVIGWKLYERFGAIPSVASGAPQRARALFLFVFAITLVSLMFEYALHEARYRPREALDHKAPQAVFYDLVSGLVSTLGLDKFPDLEYIIHSTFFGLQMVLVYFLIDYFSYIKLGVRWLSRQVSAGSRTFETVRSTPTAEEFDAAPVAIPTRQRRIHSGRLERFLSGAFLAVAIIAEYFLWAIFISLGFYSFAKLKAGLIDLDLIFRPSEFLFGTTFAWFFFSASVLVGFLFLTRLPTKYFLSINVFDIPHVKNFIFLGIYFLLPLLNAIYFFGAVIYPRVPATIGGGEPREAVMRLNGSSLGDVLPVYIVAENSSYFFVVVKDGQQPSALQISKSLVGSVQTKSQSNFSSANHR